MCNILENVLTIEEAAELLNITGAGLRYRIRAGQIDSKYYRETKTGYLILREYINKIK